MRDNDESFFVDFGSMPQENVTFQQLFEQALTTQQQKKWDDALVLYQNALDKGQNLISSEQASVIYYNMSTIASEKLDFLKAYVWSKKALSLDSHNHFASESLQQFTKKVELPQIAHQISTYQNVEKLSLFGSLDAWLGLSLVFLFLTLSLGFKNLLQQRKNQLALVENKSWAWKTYLALLFFCFTIAGTGFRWNHDRKVFAIITIDKTQIQTASGENKPVIYDAPSGLEVEVLQIQTDYAQVRYAGAFSGWVLKKNIEILSL